MLEVNRFLFAFFLQVPGNFHVGTHSADSQPEDYDFAHAIQEITFGSKIKKISEKNIGSFNALGGREKVETNGLESHEYVMKIVPTTYEDLGGTQLTAYQVGNEKYFLCI